MKARLLFTYFLLLAALNLGLSQTMIKEFIQQPAFSNLPINSKSNQNSNSLNSANQSTEINAYTDPYFGWEGHFGSVNSAVLVNNAKELWSVGYDGAVRIWDWKTGRQLYAFIPTEKQVLLIFTNQSGSEVYIYSADFEFRIYDAATRKLIRATSFNYGFSFYPALSADCENMIFFDLNARGIKVQNIESKKILFEKSIPMGRATAFAISNDSKLTAFCGADRIIKVFNILTGDSLLSLTGQTSQINSLKFTADNKYLVSGSNDKTIRIWDIASGLNVMTLVGHSGNIRGMYFSPDGKHMISLSDDLTAKVWDTDNWNLMFTLSGNNAAIYHALFTGNKIITSGGDYSIRIWNAENGKEENKFYGHTNNILGSYFIDDGSKVLTASFDKTLKLWDSKTGTMIYSMEGHTKDITLLSVSRNGKIAASYSVDYSIKIWDLSTGKLAKTLDGYYYPFSSMCLNNDGSKIFVSMNNSIIVVDTKNSQTLETFNYPFKNIMQLALSANGTKLIGVDGRNLIIINTQNGDIIRSLVTPCKSSPIFDMNDSASVIYYSAIYDNNIYKWNTGNDFSERLCFTGHSDVGTISYNQNKNILATSGYEHTIKLWDPVSRKNIRTINYNNMLGGALIKFNPVGDKILATATGVNNIRLYDVNDTISKVTITGKIELPGKFPGAVNVFLNGDLDYKSSVDTSGNFFFNISKGGSYTLRPQFAGFVFIPDSIVLQTLNKDINVNFIMKFFLPQLTTLISPGTPGNFYTGCDVEFKWEPALEADSYNLSVGSESSLNSPLYQINGITTTSYTIYGLPAGKPLYWQVCGVNKNGKGGYTETNFMTEPTTIIPPLNLTVDSTVFPDGDIILLNWTKIPAASYEVQLSSEKNFNSISAFYVQLRDTALNINNLPRNTKFFWRVRAKSGHEYSNWSYPYSFIIQGNYPPKPLLRMPESNSIIEIDSSGSSVLLKWEPIANVISYNLQVSTDKFFNGMVFYNNAVNTTQATIYGIEKSKTYYWRVSATNYAGNSEWSETWSFNPKALKADDKKNNVPDNFSLRQNYPNPFNPSTKIEYSLPHSSYVTIKIFNSIGKEVITLFKGTQDAGNHIITWEPISIPSGVYFYSIETGRFSSFRKMLLIK